MAFTSSQISTLEAALATGTKRVEYSDGRVVEYQKLSDMADALAYMKQNIATGEGTSVRGKAWSPVTGSGL